MGNKSTILLAPVLAGNRVSRINNGLKKELVSLNKEVHSLPKGKLYIRYRNNHVQFNKRENGKDKGITSFPETVYQLARRQYLQLHMQLLEQIIVMQMNIVSHLWTNQKNFHLNLHRVLLKT